MNNKLGTTLADVGSSLSVIVLGVLALTLDCRLDRLEQKLEKGTEVVPQRESQRSLLRHQVNPTAAH